MKKIKDINIKLTILFFAPVFLSVIFMFLVNRSPLDSDGCEYDILAKNILSLKGYSLDGITPYALRPPLYTFFVALIYLFTKCNPIAVVIFQIILVTFIPYVVYKSMLLAGFEAKEAFISSFAVALYPFGYIYVQQLVTEPLTTFLLAVAAYFAVKIWLSNSLKFYEVIIWGIIITLPALAKSQHISLISALILSLVIKSVFKKELFKTTKEKIIPLVIGLIIIMSPWAVRNYFHFKNPAILGEGAFGELLLKGFYETKGRWFLLTFWNEKSSGGLESFKEWQIKMEEAEKLSNEKKIPLGEAKKIIAIEEIKKDPIEAIRGYFVRFYSFWLMIPTEQSLKVKLITIFFDLIILILAVAGFITSFNAVVEKLFPIYFCVFAENAILAIGHMEARYSISVKIFIVILVGLLLNKSFERIKNGRE